MPQLLMPLMGSEDPQNLLKFACTLRCPVVTIVLRARYWQVFGTCILLVPRVAR